MNRLRTRLPLVAAAMLGLGLSACEGTNVEQRYPDKERGSPVPTYGKEPGIFGSDGINIFGGGRKRDPNAEAGGGIGVNTYLWRASLDTVSFMPLSSADPFGGVIITDWYTPPETPGERFKVTVYILDRQLRADGIRVAVFKQQNGPAGWENAAVGERVGRDLEDKILTRARELRIQGQPAS